MLHNITARKCKTYFYDTFFDEPRSVTLGENGVIAVILDENNDVMEWVGEDYPMETVQNVATWGDYLMIAHNVEPENLLIAAARRERELYADLMGLEVIESVLKY